MTAKAALGHAWFSNQTQNNDFEELYQLSIKTWLPRTPKAPIVAFMDNGSIRHLSCSQEYLAKTYDKFPRRPRHVPVEAPYKPFPRSMHLALWPKRDVGGRLSDEILSAIENNWPTATEPTLRAAWKVTRNHVILSALHRPTGRLRRVTTPTKVSRDPSRSRPTLQSSPTMLRVPFRMRLDTKRIRDLTPSSPTRNSLGTEEGNGTLMLDPPRAHLDEGSSSPHFTTSSPRPPQPRKRSLHSIKARENEWKWQSESKTSVEISADTHAVRRRVHSNVDVLPPERPSQQSSTIAGRNFRRTLKRKVSSVDLPANTKRRQRSVSIYDLPEDGDSDSDNDNDVTGALKQRSLVSDRSTKMISMNQPGGNISYLPR